MSDVIILRDNGDGTCTMSATLSTGSRSGPCAGPLYAGFQSCTALSASLVFWFRSVRASAYTQPTMQAWLDLVGIGNPTLIYGAVTVYVDHFPNSVPPITPNFLSNAGQVLSPYISVSS